MGVGAGCRRGGVPHDVALVHQEGEDRVLGDEAIKRADTDRPDAKVVRSEEHWRHAYEHRGDLPPELENNGIRYINGYLESQNMPQFFFGRSNG